MLKVPKKVVERLHGAVKRYQSVLASAKSRDVGESDTVTIVVDILTYIFGYEKYAEITSEFAIKGNRCDLAIKLDGELQLLIEVKAIGLELKENFVKQAVDYAANQGVDWVVLTNGIVWRVYHVKFEKPISQEMLIEIDFASLNSKSEKDIESLFLLCKEGWTKSVLGDYHSQRQALSRYFLGNLILSESILQVIRRELKRMSPDIRIEIDDIKHVISNEVLKREVVEGEQAEAAKKKISKSSSKLLRSKSDKSATDDSVSSAQPATEVVANEAT